MAEDKDKSGFSFDALFGEPEAFARNLARLMEAGGKAMAAWSAPRAPDATSADRSAEMVDAFKSLAALGTYWTSDLERAAKAQRRLVGSMMDLSMWSWRWMMGDRPAPSSANGRDKRFDDAGWSESLYFALFKEAYVQLSRWAEMLVSEADSLDEQTRQKAEFYVRQIAAALSPANFVFSNPKLLRETLKSRGENLVRGLELLAEDLQAGKGELRIRHSADSGFELGKTLAVTPGKVVFENEICQVIQYEAATKTVLRRPLLIVPPWINKFYVLDLTPEKSFIRWAVEQGHTVFVVSWVNPDAGQRGKGFEHYMREGILQALDVVKGVTGESEVNAIGYCVGGTLLAATLAYMAATGDKRIASVTFFAAQVDFTHAGDLKVFADADQIDALEREMARTGYLRGSRMANAFNMLRPNDLIWPYLVGRYLMGEEPAAFDMLFWNADSTRLPAANHAFYLRACYLENRLFRGEMEIGGVRLNLRKVKTPVYNLATKEDHIAPARSVLFGSQAFGGKVTFVLAGSGHIAGVVNPPSRNKYQYWTNGSAHGGDLPAWMAGAQETAGSWWPHWQAWIERQDGERVKARKVGRGRFKPIEDAPGSYVKVKG